MGALRPLSWAGIFRLGLAQVGLGAVVVLTTSTLNRVMVVELALPAMLPGLLVGLHYAMGMLRPRWGHGSDRGRRTPWILGGMAALATGGFLAACATVLMETAFWPGVALATVAFTLIGGGVGAAGTAVLALLATRCAPERRAPAATIVWLMMIVGLGATAGISGAFLDPYSSERLLTVAGCVALAAMTLATLGVTGMERGGGPAADAAQAPFMDVLRETLAEPAARRFTVFVFVSMLAFSAQDLILEPFAGHVFGFTVGESTTLAAKQQSGIFFGMVLTAVAASAAGRRLLNLLVNPRALLMASTCLIAGLALVALFVEGYSPLWSAADNIGALATQIGPLGVAAAVLAVAVFFVTLAGARRRLNGEALGGLSFWIVAGCLGSGLALAGLVAGAFTPGWPLAVNVFALGFMNGMFAVAAIASMMALAGASGAGREGARMGLWGASQAIAFGLGGLLGATLVDIARALVGEPSLAYAAVFALEATLFMVAAWLGASVGVERAGAPRGRADYRNDAPAAALVAGE